MGRIQLVHTYKDIISAENLLMAWKEFVRGKRKRKDVEEFQMRFMDNILDLHADLQNKSYRHGKYQAFKINDPKPRNIHKADVRDRILHRAIYRILYPFFERTFIPDSYSCRIGKGTHKAIKRFVRFAYTISKNNTKTCWILKCDIRRFFDSIDHAVLLEILRNYIPDSDIVWLLDRIISSFNSGKTGLGLPLGNLTSQLLVNIYMNSFDQSAKHNLKTKYYIRYADDFVIFSRDKFSLEKMKIRISGLLIEKLRLSLHPDKVLIKTLSSGLDFLGWVHFPDHRILRTTTKRRMIKRTYENPIPGTFSSYSGLLRHGNTHKLQAQIKTGH